MFKTSKIKKSKTPKAQSLRNTGSQSPINNWLEMCLMLITESFL